MRRFTFALALAALLVAAVSLPVLAQGSPVQLGLSRNFGFSLGSQIQGTFTLAISGPTDISLPSIS